MDCTYRFFSRSCLSQWLRVVALTLATLLAVASASALHGPSSAETVQRPLNSTTALRYIYEARTAQNAHSLFTAIRNKKNKKWWQKQQGGCPKTNQCSFVDSFKYMQASRWKVSDGYANGVPFACWWSKSATAIDQNNGQLKLTLSQQHGHGKPYKSGQLMSHNWHGYGCYEVRMRPVAQPGVITTFFSYTGPWDAAPDKSKAHNEIDVEFVWKQGKLTLQANYFTNGQGGNEHLLPIDFNPAASMNNYGFKWTSNSIMWFVNGKMVYKTSKNLPKAHQAPHKIMMSLWPVRWQASQWGGTFEYKGHRTAAYDGVRFTKGQDCKILNWFP